MSTVHTRISVNISRLSTLDLYVVDCPSCGVVFAITAEYEDRRRADGQGFYCPNGHRSSWSESEATRQSKRADEAIRQRNAAWVSHDAARDQALAAERSARAYRGHLTRMRNYLANGVCPVGECRRNFANVRAHISKQHPQWAQNHPEALA
jgi:hypothetical protein